MHELDLFVRVVALAGRRIDLPTTRDFGSPFKLSPFDGHRRILLATVRALATVFAGFAAVDGHLR